MKQPTHDDTVERLRDQLRLRIDAAARSVADVLQVTADLFIATRHRTADEGIAIAKVESITKVESRPVPDLMTRQQAAEYLGVKAQTLAVWKSTGRYSLPFVKVGSNTRYRKTDLDKFLQRHTKYYGSGDGLN